MPKVHVLLAITATLLVLMMSGGCATGRGPWREVQTPNFLLRTDLVADEALRAGTALEERATR